MQSPHDGSQDNDRPYISVVVAARNDDHGGNLLGRMQVFVDAWIGQAKRHNLSSELIIVEWNPPGDRDRLEKVLRWPRDRPHTAMVCPTARSSYPRARRG